MAFAIVLLVGPGELEIERARDLFDALVHHEGRRAVEADLFLVNDGNSNTSALESLGRPFRRFFHLRNPLTGSRSAPYAKMTAGMIQAISEAAARGPYRFVLKLDTDALVINPFHDGLAGFFEANPGVGMAGSYLRFPNGGKRKREGYWAYLIQRSAHPAFARSALRTPHRLPAALLRIARRRALLASARRRGYRDGFHVLGGSYAISGRVLESWRSRSVGKLTRLFEDTELSEDVVVSLLVKWLGFELGDFNRPGEVFGVWFRALRLAPEELLLRYAIIHSVKTRNQQDEGALREFYRNRRNADALAERHGA